MSLKGRGAVITGGGRGIGKAVARALAEQGASIIVSARTTKEIESVAAELTADGHKAYPMTCDVADEASVQAMAKAAVEFLGTVDILVNNAGIAPSNPVKRVTLEEWNQVMGINVTGTFLCTRAFLPGMLDRSWGRIVNVCSTAGKRPSAAMPEYSVAKAAELSLSRLFADRYAKRGVMVNAICPGPVEAELWMEPGGLLDQSQRMSGAGSREEALETAGGKRPIGRLAAVEEIAAAIVFLCSERASYVSGAAWSVDGGTVQVIV